MDGNWGNWGEWSNCPVSCGGGEQIRIRNCNNPKPSGGGKACDGEKEEKKKCAIFECGRKFLFFSLCLSSFFSVTTSFQLSKVFNYKVRITFYFRHQLNRIGRRGSILGNPGATGRDDAIFSSKQYFRAKVYFKC